MIDYIEGDRQYDVKHVLTSPMDSRAEEVA
jgi:hypothetical protein